ncbi:tetratricopeptide repeat protein [Chryseobacterium indologenes]|uniref:tetratricopeptide repeat protein n=1 Tax=Chryseobacterium TaxID=59732 RepID=UPI001623A759|nr:MULTISPECIES: tetratricopeptide repeat protein [Chryseobacterium]MDM1553099.1 tetratricopeptide repeat protein [Chryseobacterium indologenes]WET49224.1 tetratricopeptide repeat protein [Chryseobacterium indologenes]
MIKLKNKAFRIASFICLFFLSFLSAQSNYYDLDLDQLQDEVTLENNLITVHFGNKKTSSFELPEIVALRNTSLGYMNPSEITIHYSGDRGLYGAVNFLYKNDWYIKNVNFYNPCQECEDQNFKLLTKNINLLLKNIDSEDLEIDSKGFNSLKFFDDQGIIKPYKDLKKFYTDLSSYPLLAERFNETELSGFKKKYSLSRTNIDDYNNIAVALSNKGNYKAAIELLKQIISKFPNRAVAYLNLADSYWNIGEKDNGKEYYKKYISLLKSQKKDLNKIPRYIYARVK